MYPDVTEHILCVILRSNHSVVSQWHPPDGTHRTKELPQRSLPPAASTPWEMRRNLRVKRYEKITGVSMAATSIKAIKVSSILLAKSCNFHDFQGWERIGPGVPGFSMLPKTTSDVVYARGWSCMVLPTLPTVTDPTPWCPSWTTVSWILESKATFEEGEECSNYIPL